MWWAGCCFLRVLVLWASRGRVCEFTRRSAVAHAVQGVTVAGTIAASVGIYFPHRFGVATYPAAVADKIDMLVAANVRLAKFTANRERQLAERKKRHRVTRATSVGHMDSAAAAGPPRRTQSDLGLPLRARDDSDATAGDDDVGGGDSPGDRDHVSATAVGSDGGVPVAAAATANNGSARTNRRVVILPPNVWRGANFVHPYLGSRSYLVPATAQVRRRTHLRVLWQGRHSFGPLQHGYMFAISSGRVCILSALV